MYFRTPLPLLLLTYVWLRRMYEDDACPAPLAALPNPLPFGHGTWQLARLDEWMERNQNP